MGGFQRKLVSYFILIELLIASEKDHCSIARSLRVLMDMLTHFRPMEFSIKLQLIMSEWSIVYM